MVADDFNWLVEHGVEIARDYAGKWIAVRDGRVVGVGDTATEAAAQARSCDEDKPFILEAVESEADVIYADIYMATCPHETLRRSVGAVCSYRNRQFSR